MRPPESSAVLWEVSAAVIGRATVTTIVAVGTVKAQEVQDNNCDDDDPPGIGIVAGAGAVVQITEKHSNHLSPFYAVPQKGCMEKRRNFTKKLHFRPCNNTLNVV